MLFRSVVLSFEGVEQFSGEMYILDLETQIIYPITANASISLAFLAGTEDRYVLCRIPSDANDLSLINSSDDIILFQPSKGELVVKSMVEMNEIQIYTINGQLVEQRQYIHSTMEPFFLNEGVYLIDVTTHERKSCVKALVY